jgi:hypothetical protein
MAGMEEKVNIWRLPDCQIIHSDWRLLNDMTVAKIIKLL